MRALATAVLALLIVSTALAEQAEPPALLPEVQVESAGISSPVEETMNPADRLRPARDVTELLRELTGFSSGRLGGAGGEPALRGLTGSRLPVVVDGVAQDAVCNHRMDAPTAGLSPDAFASLMLVRGPQTVRYGPSVAGVLSFARDDRAWQQSGARLSTQLTRGSWDRHDDSLTASVGDGRFGLAVDAQPSSRDDYRDGEGRAVFARYWRRSHTARLGFALDDGLRLEIGGTRSNAQAAYPAFHMDATALAASESRMRLSQTLDTGWLRSVELLVYERATDHAMDDYSLRPVHSTLTDFAFLTIRQTDRLDMIQRWRSSGSRLSATLLPTERVELSLGYDQRNDLNDGYNVRRAETCLTFKVFPFTQTCAANRRADPFYDLEWQRRGYWSELRWQATEFAALIVGLRRDRQENQARGLFDFASGSVLQPGAYSTTSESLQNRFARIESQLDDALTGFVAAAHSERPADFIERASFSGFLLPRERAQQLDAGLRWQQDTWRVLFNLFAARHNGFILTEGGTRAYPIRAWRQGGEAMLAWQATPHLQLSSQLAWVHADNLSERQALAQTPPPELRLAVNYQRTSWGGQAALRFVKRQDRIHVNHGNTTGLDLGPTPGFGTLDLSVWWMPEARLRVALGIDNLFDRAYSEHLSRTGTFAPPGFVSQLRVPEPGRSAWLSLKLALD